jgi:hypothetical protein
MSLVSWALHSADDDAQLYVALFRDGMERKLHAALGRFQISDRSTGIGDRTR